MTATIYWNLVEANPRLSWWNGTGAVDFLSAGELARLEKLRFPKRRREWLLGRWAVKNLLRACLPECTGRALDEIEIENEPGGAPYFLGMTGGTISISHREDAAACACAPELAAGLDLEQVEPRSDLFVSDFFTPAEAGKALSLHGLERDRYTALVWSAKEAALKALRTGLRLDTRSIEVDEDTAPGRDGWGGLRFTSTLPEAQALRGWWRIQEERVITLAAVQPSTEEMILKYVPDVP